MNKGNKNILNNLKSSTSGFQVPKGYFEDMEGTLYEKLSLEENKEVDQLSDGSNEPILERLSSKGNSPGFKVPENYFEKLETGLTPKANKTVKVGKSKVIRLVSLSMAASILLFFGIKYMYTGEVSNGQVSVGNQEIVNWVDEELVMFDTYEIAEAFNDTEFEQNLYYQESIEDYLNDIDIESLIIEN